MAESKKRTKGLYNVRFIEKLGSMEKDSETHMELTTAEALEKHGKVKILTKVKHKKAVKEE